MEYRKKTTVIEAIEFQDNGERIAKISDFIGDQDLRIDYADPGSPVIKIKTPVGIMTGNVGDYIIKGMNGELYLCKKDIFEKTYEPVK
jgi:hypothetical protein